MSYNNHSYLTSLFVVGNYAPVVLQSSIMLSYLFWPWGAPRLGLAAWFAGGSIASICLNILLKEIIRDPRPVAPTNIGSGIWRFDQWGMPSGHMQRSAFTLSFWYFAGGSHLHTEEVCRNLTNWSFGVGATIILFITALQRYIYGKHNVIQLLVGTIIGTVLAYGIVTKGVHNRTNEFSFLKK